MNIVLRGPEVIAERLSKYETLHAASSEKRLSRHPAWLSILHRGLGHQPYCVEGYIDKRLTAILPLTVVRGPVFGSFLVSLPYLNSGGISGDLSVSTPVENLTGAMISQAVELADRLRVRFLELRNDVAVVHPKLTASNSSKVHMRLSLPRTEAELWTSFPAKVRNQVRNGENGQLAASWGGAELLDEFYQIFSHNMRDLGTPVFGIRLFREILTQFPEQSEICVVRQGAKSLAAAILLHGQGTTEVPSASSLREFNSTNANMLMYKHLLIRAIERGQSEFDFGRSSPDSGTFRFKKQWGALPVPSVWQYHVRRGSIQDMRPENTKFGFLQRMWRRLPLSVANRIGPMIVRGIP